VAAASTTGRSRLLGIEGLRAIAASSILVYHVWLFGSPSDAYGLRLGPASKFFFNLQSGVTLFFVLSGFLLFRPFAAAVIRGTAPPSLRAYARNRALRIVPAYWTLLLLVALLLDHRLLRNPLELLANFFLAQNYIPAYVDTGIVPAWSLAIEVAYYALLPLLGAMAFVSARRGGLNRVAAAFVPVAFMAGLGVVGKVILRVEGLGFIWASSLPPRADWFAAGMALAAVRVLWEDGRLHFGRRSGLAALAAAAALTVAAMALFYGNQLTAIEYQTPIAMACALLLGIVVFSDARSRTVRYLTWRPLYALGLASYSLFLCHHPLEWWMRQHGLTLAGRGGFVVNLATVGLVSVIVAAATYRYVERPALARKRTWQRGGSAGRPAREAAAPEHATTRPVAPSASPAVPAIPSES